MLTKFLWRLSLGWVFNECVRGYIVVVHAPIPTALAAPVFCSRRQSRRLEVNMMERLFTRMRTGGPVVLSLFLFFAAREVWNTRPELMIICDQLAGWHRVLVGRRDLCALATQAFGLARVDLGL